MDLIGAESVNVHKSSLTVEAGTGGKFYFEVEMADVPSSTHDWLVGATDASYAGALPGDNANTGIGHRTTNPTGGGTGADRHNNDRLEDGSYVPIDDYTAVPFNAVFGVVADTVAKTFQVWCRVDADTWESWSEGAADLGARPIDNVVDTDDIEIRLKDYQSSGKAIRVNFGQRAFRHSDDTPIPVDYLGWGTP